MNRLWTTFWQRERFSLRDCGRTLLLLAGAVLLCLVMRMIDNSSQYVSMVFILAVFLVARTTNGYIYGIFAAMASVLIVNYFFSYPYFRFDFTSAGYPVAILSLLAVSVITSTLTTQAKNSVEARLEAEREKTRGNLLRAVSHDLRTPLTGILGATSAILENDETLDHDERMSLLKDVQEDAQWLIRMVENLLTITRMDGREARVVKRPEAAEEVLEDTIVKFKKRYPGFRVAVQIPDELMMIPMDAVLIGQVLLNLMENAVHHGVYADRLEIGLKREGNWCEFTVRDNGCGIALTALPHILDGSAATAGVSTTDKRRNMGIGLSVCHTIIRAHGGTMEAENCPDGGALFRFRLPL